MKTFLIFLTFTLSPLVVYPSSCPGGRCSLPPHSVSSVPYAGNFSQSGTTSATRMTSLSDFRTEPAAPHPAVVRIVVENAKSQNYGSGTWIRLSSSQCAVLTCAHLFDTETPRKISVYFSNHVAFVAQIQAIDRRWDIALLQTSTVDTLSSDLNRKLPMPVTLAQDPPRQGDYLRMCGYGPNGRSVWVLGKTRGYCHLTTVSETHTLVVSGVARQGDSGAPILNLEGVLVGVLWGTDGSSMYGTWSGKILQTFSVAFQENRVTIQKPDKVGDMEIAKKNEISGNSVDSGRSVSSGNSGSSEDSVNGTSEKTLEEQVAELAKMAENVEKVENTEGREKLEAVLTARKPFASFLERIALSRTSRMARTPRFPRIAQSREEDTENKLSPTPEPEVEMDLIAEILPPVTVAENTSGKNTGKMVEKFSGNMTGNMIGNMTGSVTENMTSMTGNRASSESGRKRIFKHVSDYSVRPKDVIKNRIWDAVAPKHPYALLTVVIALWLLPSTLVFLVLRRRFRS